MGIFSKRLQFPTIILTMAFLFLWPVKAAGALTIEARSAILMDFETGQILFEQKAHERLPPASVTKVMTMLLIMEAVEAGRIKWDDRIETSAFAAGMGGSQIYLRQGETMTLAEMTKAIAMVSANDASTAVAEHLYGTVETFINRMNERAGRLGLRNTNFQNEHGLPAPEHYSSAHDLAVMSRALLQYPGILQWTSIWTDTLRGGAFTLRNTNDLVRTYRGMDGLKTGHTQEAGFCLAATAKQEDMRLISVILGAETNQKRVEQTTRLLNYGFRNFARVVAVKETEEVGTVRIRDASPQNVRVAAPREFGVLVERGREKYVDRRVEPLRDLKLPVSKGEPVAEMIVTSGNQVVGRTELVALTNVRRANPVVRLFRTVIDWVTGLFRRGRR